MNQPNELSEFGQTVPFLVRTGIKALKMEKDGIRLMVPLEPNINHIGIMYAGALWTLSETMGGAVYHVYLITPDTFPIVKSLNIKFVKPAPTDCFCEYKMDPEEAKRIVDACEKNGKADYEIFLELKDANGNAVAITEGVYQVRKGKGL